MPLPDTTTLVLPGALPTEVGSLLPTLNAHPPMVWGLIAVSGIFGALVRVAWLDKPLRGAWRDASGSWHLGFYGEVLVGIAVALLVDGHPIRAGLGAVFAPSILGALQQVILSLVGGRTPPVA